jgi:hypothetical protein
MRRMLFASVVAVIALSACGGSSGPSQAQLAAESKWSHGQGGKYLAEVAAYLKGINRDVLASFVVAGPLAGAALLASAFPPPIDASTYDKVMHDYFVAGEDLEKYNTNGFIAAIDAAGTVLTTVKPPWGANLPGGKDF